MVTIDKIERGIAAYLDGELMPKLPSNGLEKVLIGTALSLFIRKLGTIIDGYSNSSMLKTLGIINDNKEVDIDLLSEEFKKNMPTDGLKVEVPIIGGMTFHNDDVDTLYTYITES